jgi:hypothetical protein
METESHVSPLGSVASTAGLFRVTPLPPETSNVCDGVPPMCEPVLTTELGDATMALSNIPAGFAAVAVRKSATLGAAASRAVSDVTVDGLHDRLKISHTVFTMDA